MSRVFDRSGAAAHLTEKGIKASVRTLDRWRQTGDGPTFLKGGKYVNYTEEALDSYVESRVFRSTSEYRNKTAA